MITYVTPKLPHSSYHPQQFDQMVPGKSPQESIYLYQLKDKSAHKVLTTPQKYCLSIR